MILVEKSSHIRTTNTVIVLREIEEEDAVWQAKARKKQGLSETPSSENNTSPEPEAFKDEAQKKADSKPRKALSSRDYGYS